MKINEFVHEQRRGQINDQDVDTIKSLVDKLRQNIHSFGGAKIDGQHGILDVSARQVLASFGIDLNNLTHIDTDMTWVHKNGRDKFAIGYK